VLEGEEHIEKELRDVARIGRADAGDAAVVAQAFHARF
jgi:hypothetical protein